MNTISVCMATYRGEALVQPQLESILRQRRPVDEIVLCDDSPGGTTAAVARELLQTSGVRHRLFTNEARLGVVRNFERAITASVGDIVLLADQDDIWHPEKAGLLERQLDANPSVDAVFTDANVERHGSLIEETLWELVGFSERQKRYKTDALAVHLRAPVVTGATLAIRRRALALVLPFSEHALHDVWIGLILAATGTISAVPDRPMTYRLHGDNVAGVPSRSLLGQLRARRALTDNNRRLADLHSDALERLAGAVGEDVLDRIRRKRDHCERRSRLSSSASRRLIEVISDLPAYGEFAGSWKGIAFDLVLGGDPDSHRPPER